MVQTWFEIEKMSKAQFWIDFETKFCSLAMPLSIDTLYLRSKVPLKIQQTSLSSGLNVAGDMLVHPPHFGYTVRTVPYFKMNLNA